MGLFTKFFGNKNGVQGTMVEHHPEQSKSSVPSTLVKDPVCGMEVDVDTAVAKSQYQGQTYYFCSTACKTQFDKNPAKCMSGQATGRQAQKHGCC